MDDLCVGGDAVRVDAGAGEGHVRPAGGRQLGPELRLAPGLPHDHVQHGVVTERAHGQLAFLEATGRAVTEAGEVVLGEVGALLEPGRAVGGDLVDGPAGAGRRRVAGDGGQGLQEGLALGAARGERGHGGGPPLRRSVGTVG
jgi:hypothetical protein